MEMTERKKPKGVRHTSRSPLDEETETVTIKHINRRVEGLRSASTVLIVGGFILNVVSFCTPYWYVSWSRVPSTFIRLGLWEVCLEGYVDPLNYDLRAYVGCWWVFAPEYREIIFRLTPPWFIAVQAFMTLSIMTGLVSVAFVVIQWLPPWTFMSNPEKQWKRWKLQINTPKVLGILMLINSIFIALAVIVFAALCQERTWMPRPDLNYPSWSYGFAIIVAFMSFFAFWILWRVPSFLNEAKEIYSDQDEANPAGIPLTQMPPARR